MGISPFFWQSQGVECRRIVGTHTLWLISKSDFVVLRIVGTHTFSRVCGFLLSRIRKLRELLRFLGRFMSFRENPRKNLQTRFRSSNLDFLLIDRPGPKPDGNGFDSPVESAILRTKSGCVHWSEIVGTTKCAGTHTPRKIHRKISVGLPFTNTIPLKQRKSLM